MFHFKWLLDIWRKDQLTKLSEFRFKKWNRYAATGVNDNISYKAFMTKKVIKRKKHWNILKAIWVIGMKVLWL